MQTTQTQETFDLLDQDYHVKNLLISTIAAYQTLPEGTEKANLQQHIKVFEETVVTTSWHTDDVKTICPNISEDDALRVLNQFVSHDLTDADWFALKWAADEYFEELS
ncbi:hypothetical protein [Neisseria sp. Ec49-e6-T10]|uniref:hypothetical protein n=1 Tax=Neisseria sp. Ec49-e6-T10 TaxID=3140744 RepID=UPI003EB99BA3